MVLNFAADLNSSYSPPEHNYSQFWTELASVNISVTYASKAKVKRWLNAVWPLKNPSDGHLQSDMYVQLCFQMIKHVVDACYSLTTSVIACVTNFGLWWNISRNSLIQIQITDDIEKFGHAMLIQPSLSDLNWHAWRQPDACTHKYTRTRTRLHTYVYSALN